MTAQLWTVVGALALTAVLGWWWQRRNGALSAPRSRQAAVVLTREALGVELGREATLVQFSSEACQPCRATARVLRRLADAEPGVVHVELDVSEHGGLVSELGILRTPTVFAVSPGGHIVGRSSGAMTPAQARETLGAVMQAH